MLKLLDLFSGIGGFSLGMEATNRIKTIAFVEKDKFCQKVLNKNFKNIPIEEDIRNVKGSNYTADIVSGGFPCQPFSVAGKRKGKNDDRYLWDETIRVVAETKPKWFVGENVEGIINISNGTVLQQIQQDLEKEGFQVQCLVIPASGVGAWHQRKRVWIIGCNVSNSNSNRNTNEIERSNGEKEKVQREHRQEDSSAWKFIRTNSNDVPNSSSQRQFTRNNREMETKTKDKKGTRDQSSFQTLSSCSDVPNTNSGNVETGCERQRRVRQESEGERSSSNATNIRQTLSNSKSMRYGGGSGKECGNQGWNFQQSKQKGSEVRSEAQGCSSQTLSNTDSKGLQGCSLPTELEREQRQVITKRDTEKQQTWWEAQSSLCGVPNGISYELDKDRTNRIKALGNSIVPLIAYEIGKAIISAEDQSD
jgi:DNA (cytosine-5)-methyltransferase 1